MGVWTTETEVPDGLPYTYESESEYPSCCTACTAIFSFLSKGKMLAWGCQVFRLQSLFGF